MDPIGPLLEKIEKIAKGSEGKKSLINGEENEEANRSLEQLNDI